jgi:hypothetical protein
MPPSQETPVEKKDIANTTLNLDISESGPSTARKTPTSNNSLIVSKPPASEDKGNSKVSFLNLPIRIRLQIYGILLLSRVDYQKQTVLHRDRWESSGIRPTWRQIIFAAESIRGGQDGYHFLHVDYAQSEILQTCRQIYHEGNSILYSINFFFFPYVDYALEFIKQIGLVNFRSIRSLLVLVDDLSESLFLELFNILAEEDNGVRVMEYTGNSTGDKLDFKGTLEKTRELRRQDSTDACIYLGDDGRYRLSSRMNNHPVFLQEIYNRSRYRHETHYLLYINKSETLNPHRTTA